MRAVRAENARSGIKARGGVTFLSSGLIFSVAFAIITPAVVMTAGSRAMLPREACQGRKAAAVSVVRMCRGGSWLEQPFLFIS